jgi:hypothetical protein
MHQAESANPKNTRNFYRVFDESGYKKGATNRPLERTGHCWKRYVLLSLRSQSLN